jgi:hypothetical protein
MMENAPGLTTGTNSAQDSGAGAAVPDASSLPAPGAEDQAGVPATTEDLAQNAAETTEQQEARKQSAFQRRLDRQRTARVAAETEVRLLREQNQRLEAQSRPAQETGEPKREQFEDYESYLRAVTRYDAAQVANQSLQSERQARQQAEQQGREVASTQKLAADWQARETAFQAQQKDYAAVVSAYVEEGLPDLSGAARMAIVESEVGPALLHHLAKNPDVAERITDLSPLRQVAELGKLETSLAIPAGKKGTNAPAPPSPLNGGRSISRELSGDMSQKEYEALRAKQGARWARR